MADFHAARDAGGAGHSGGGHGHRLRRHLGSGLRSAHRDEDRLLLGFVAQNLLVRSRLDLNPIAGPRSGDIGGGLRWRIESEPYVLPKDILPEMPTAAADSPARFPKDGKGAGEGATASAGYFARDPKTEAGDRPAFGSTPAATDQASTASEVGRDGTTGEGDQPTAARPREPLGWSRSSSRRATSASSSAVWPRNRAVNVPLHADRRSGFTLIELLVSLVVLSLIAVIMVSGLRFVVRAVASTDSRREALEELTLGLSVLRGELERAEP